MIITWQSEYEGHIGFRAVAEDYDGTPHVDHFWMDKAPVDRHWDREAIAAYLVFGSYASGRLAVPHKFSPAAAKAMSSMSAPVDLRPEPIEYYAKRLPFGTRTLRLLKDSPLARKDTDPPNQDVGYLQVLRSDRASGAIRTINGLTVASNAWVHSDSQGSELASVYPYLAMGALFAEDLEANVLEIEADVDTTSEEYKHLQHLLAMGRLGLRVVAP